MKQKLSIDKKIPLIAFILNIHKTNAREHLINKSINYFKVILICNRSFNKFNIISTEIIKKFLRRK